MSVNSTSLEPFLNGWEDSGGRCDDDRGVGSELMPQATKKTADGKGIADQSVKGSLLMSMLAVLEARVGR